MSTSLAVIERCRSCRRDLALGGLTETQRRYVENLDPRRALKVVSLKLTSLALRCGRHPLCLCCAPRSKGWPPVAAVGLAMDYAEPKQRYTRSPRDSSPALRDPDRAERLDLFSAMRELAVDP